MTESKAKPPLGRADWLSAALNLLASDGVTAVQITKLALIMKVTRGSFYWHFNSRDDLLGAMLAEWQATNNTPFEQSFKDCLSLDEGVFNFFEIWVGEGPFSPPLDQSIRDWARLDDNVLQQVRTADNKRILQVSAMFKRFGFSVEDAGVRARVLYFSQVGYTAINLGEAMDERLSLLARYYVAYTGRDLDPEIARSFIQRMKDKS